MRAAWREWRRVLEEDTQNITLCSATHPWNCITTEVCSFLPTVYFLNTNYGIALWLSDDAEALKLEEEQEEKKSDPSNKDKDIEPTKCTDSDKKEDLDEITKEKEKVQEDENGNKTF